MMYCEKHSKSMPIDGCPLCVREERDRLRVGDADILNAIDDWRLRAGVAEAEVKRLREQVALLLELNESGGKREQELREERDRLREKLDRAKAILFDVCRNYPGNVWYERARKAVES